MELRSNRSRSKTPLLRGSVEKELMDHENNIGQTFVRTTRSTVIKTALSDIDNITDIDSLESYSSKSAKIKNSKSDRVLRKTRYKTSDYSSSEDNEQLTPNTIKQNDNNEFIEDIRRSVSRASGVSALDVYRAAGDYWNKFPKTDYTYSPHSKYRTEIAPGVIAMPNMSRRSLHDYSLTKDEHTNTELYERTETDYLTTKLNYDSVSSNHNNEKLTSIQPRSLFNNHNYKDKYFYASSRSSIRQQTFFQKIVSIFTSTIITIFTWASAPFSYAYNTQNSGFVWLGKTIHKIATRMMLWDTWLLRSNQTKRKLRSILALCLIPLLLLGGWWLVSGLGSAIYGTLINSTSTVISSLPTISILNKENNIKLQLDDDISHSYKRNVLVEEKIIREKLILEPPNADEIAAKLTVDQLEAIANAIKYKLSIENSYVNNEQPVDDAIVKHQQLIIDQLKNEIDKIRAQLINSEQIRNEDIANLVTQLRSENAQNSARLMYQLRSCCRSSFIHMESYVTRILKDLLGAPHYLSTPKDISHWLHSTFVAKEDLESRLTNLTDHLKSDYDALIQNNGEILMDKIMSRISMELNKRIEKAVINIEKRDVKEVNINSLTDEHIKKIVADALSIYDADKTGLVDHALESAGGQVLSTRCTESYQARTAVLSILGIPLWYPMNTPRTVITPGMTPGECWAFQNFPGFLVIKLAAPVKIEAFSLEHISKMLVASGKIDSAPKDFAVYGLRNESDKEPILIGQYTYNYDGPSLQYFAAVHHGLVFDIIELRILSNHGNPNYTCLYRFRVHGRLSTEPT